jgi:hypothetical protein
MNNIHCLNCGNTYRGNYCPNCGQKATVTKLTWKSLIGEFVHFFTHAEHSFVHTSKRLITEPGLVMKDFLDGKRKQIHKPVTFLLIWGAIEKLVSELYRYCTSHFELYRFAESRPALRVLWNGPKNASLAANETWASMLILAPLLVLIGWLVFRKTKTSFVERWVIMIYGFAVTAMVSVLMSTTTFLLRLVHFPVSRGTINDGYLIGYQLIITWTIYSFQKIYKPRMSKGLQLITAFFVALLANYASDIAFYLLYRFSA